MKKDLVVENGALLYQGIPVDEMLAYPVWLAARRAGCSYDTIWRARRNGQLKANAFGLIPRAELLRWLNEPGPRRASRRKAQNADETAYNWCGWQTLIPGIVDFLRDHPVRRASPRKAQIAEERPRKWYIDPEAQPFIPGTEKWLSSNSN